MDIITQKSTNGNARLRDAIKPREARQTGNNNALLLTAKLAAAACGKSLRTWRSWDAAGWIPRPVRIGRSVLWRADELREWIAAGCPRRGEWEARQ